MGLRGYGGMGVGSLGWMGKVGSLGKGVYMQAAWDEELRKAGEWLEEIGATGMKVE